MAELTRRELVLALAAVPNVPCRAPHHLIRLAGVDLSGLDLRGLNLAHADLAGADLRGCDLSDARLYECDFSGADLTGAILRGVYAERASFVAAVLVNVDVRPSERNLFYGTSLAGADLRGADLTGAVLSGADLCGADLRDATLAGVSLDGVRTDAGTRLPGVVTPVTRQRADESPCDLDLLDAARQAATRPATITVSAGDAPPAPVRGRPAGPASDKVGRGACVAA